MSSRVPHGAYAAESRFVKNTLRSLVHILEVNEGPGREVAINSLGNLLNHITPLRLAGQVHFKHSTAWTEKCNMLLLNITRWRDELTNTPSSGPRVAAEISSSMMFVAHALPTNVDYYTKLWEESDDQRRGDRSGAPSPEPVPKQRNRKHRNASVSGSSSSHRR